MNHEIPDDQAGFRKGRGTRGQIANIPPDVNAGMRVVPQVLTKKADHFLWAAQLLYDMGYEEINLNVGCPSGTVTAKGKGAGMRTGFGRSAVELQKTAWRQLRRIPPDSRLPRR